MFHKLLYKARSVFRNAQAKPHLVYVVISAIAAIGFVFIVPPFQGPDEEIHYNRAYQLVRGHIILEKQTNGKWGGCIPLEAITDMLETGGFSPGIRGNVNAKYSTKNLRDNLTDGIERPNQCGVYDTKNTYAYTPLGYLPAVVGIGLVDSINGPPIIGFYLARLMTIFFTISIMALAIYIMPRRKTAFMVLLLTPMLIFQQTVISIDGVSFAVLALFIACVIKLFYQSSIKSRQWIKLGGLTLLLCVMKPLLYIFIPLILLLFSRGKKQTILFIAGAVMVIFFSTLTTRLIYGNIESNGAQGSDAKQQIEHLKNSPLKAPKVALNTYMTQRGDSIYKGVIGVFGAADTNLPSWVYALSIVTIVAALKIAPKEEKIHKTSKRFVFMQILLLAVYFILVNGAIYVTYSPVGLNYIYGVQGRYFLPILMLLITLPTATIAINKQQYDKLSRYLVMSATTVLVLSLIFTLQRYYIPV